MAVNYLYLAAASTAASAAGLQWWAASLLDAGDGRGKLELVLGSRVTLALLVNLAVHVFLLVVLAVKSLFFEQLNSSETRKVLEHIINYVIYKGTFLPLVVPPNSQQLILWSTWLGFLCSLKMFQSLAKDRLECLNASPTATPSKYFRVYSALLLVLSADLLWMKLCVGFCRSCNSKLFWLLFFEPLSIAFETLQAIMVHGFQLVDIWQQHLMGSGADFLDFQKSYKQSAGRGRALEHR